MAAAYARAEQGGGGARATNLHAPHLTAAAPHGHRPPGPRSPSPCARRIRKLEAEGYITGYGARIDERKMGFDFSVFVSVRLDRQVDDRLVTFEHEVARCPPPPDVAEDREQ